jgi:hypothetical protein
MARIIVTADQTNQRDAPVLLDESVSSVHLSTDHAAMQLIERLGWALNDAEDAERAQSARLKSARPVPARYAPRRARRRGRSARPAHA